MSNPILGLISSAGGLFSTALANQANRDITEQTNLMNMQLTHESWANAEAQAEAADQRTRNLYKDLYSPAAMRQQLEDAGLSVGLMYGKGGIGGSGQIGAQAQTPSPIPMQSARMESVLDAQVAALLANAKKTEAEAEEHQAGAEEKRGNLSVQEQTKLLMKKQIESIGQDIKESDKRIEEMTAEIVLKNKQAGKEEANTALLKQQEAYYKAETDLLNVDLLTRGEINETTLKELNEKIDTYKAEQAKFYSEVRKNNAETKTIDESRDYVVKKLMVDWLNAGFEYKYITPQLADKIANETDMAKIRKYLMDYKKTFFDDNIGKPKTAKEQWEAIGRDLFIRLNIKHID